MVVRVGMIGLGDLGRAEADTYDAMGDAAVVAVSDVDESVRLTAAQRYDAAFYEDYTEMIAEQELDAVTITTPHTLHYEQAMAAINAELDVFLEKPMVTDTGDAEALVAAADDADVVLQVGYQRHSDPAYQTMRDTVLEGVIGKPVAVHAYLSQGWLDYFTDENGEPRHWRLNPALSGGGELYDSGSHLLDAVLWVTDTVPETVAAEMTYAAFSERGEEPHGVDVNTGLTATLEGERPVQACISVIGDGDRIEPEEELIVFGQDGRVSFADDVLTVQPYGEPETVMDFSTDPRRSGEQLTARKLESFVDAVRARDTPLVPGEYGVQVTAMTEAAYRSDEEDRPEPVT